MGQDVNRIADSLWHSMRRGQHMPAAWKNKLSLDEAYPVQLAMLERHRLAGQRHAGWKVGLTSAAMRAQQGVDSPCLGYLLEAGRRDSPAVLSLGELIAPKVEVELCVRLGTRLCGSAVTPQEAGAAIAMIHPAFEIAEVRGNFSADLPLAIADNVQQKAFIVGPGLAVHDADTAIATLSDARVTVSRNGAECDRAHADAVMGSPINSLVWLAGFLARWDLALEPGMMVMTGSFTRQQAIAPADSYQAVFSGIGSVMATFES